MLELFPNPSSTPIFFKIFFCNKFCNDLQDCKCSQCLSAILEAWLLLKEMKYTTDLLLTNRWVICELTSGQNEILLPQFVNTLFYLFTDVLFFFIFSNFQKNSFYVRHPSNSGNYYRKMFSKFTFYLVEVADLPQLLSGDAWSPYCIYEHRYLHRFQVSY